MGRYDSADAQLEGLLGTVFALAFNFDYSVLASMKDVEANETMEYDSVARDTRMLGRESTAALLEQLHPGLLSPGWQIDCRKFCRI